MMSISVNACLFAIFVTAINSIVKQTKPEFSAFVKIAATIMFFALIPKIILPIITYINSLFAGSKIEEYGETALKALGIALIAEICCRICNDCGENTLAKGAELICKLEILLLCIPMLEKILSIVKEVMTW